MPLVFINQESGFVLDHLPEFDQRFTEVADLVSTNFDLAAQQLVEDRSSTQEGLVVGVDSVRKSGDDLRSLTPLAPSPLDENVLRIGWIVSCGTRTIR